MIDQAYFDQVYNDHKQLVYNVCLHYLLNPQDAEDTAQEVFVKVYQHFHQFNPAAASLKTWIFRIAINQSLDFLKAKKTKKRRGFITSLFKGESIDNAESSFRIDHPGIAAENKESVESLLKIIYSLPDNQKTAIILNKIEDRPQREVAEIMDTSLKAVESLLQRAKQNIKKKLKQSEG